jgi:hypothetical protein
VAGKQATADESKALGTVPVGQETKLANAHEAMWKNMLHVAPQELGCRECHQALLIAARIVLPTERDLFPIERNQPVIADGHAMGIAAQIAKHRLGTRHGLFDIDDPAFPIQRLQKCPECLGSLSGPVAPPRLSLFLR